LKGLKRLKGLKVERVEEVEGVEGVESWTGGAKDGGARSGVSRVIKAH
jgi:hypothetical protein